MPKSPTEELVHMPGCRCAEFWTDLMPGEEVPLLMVSERVWTSPVVLDYPAGSDLLTFSLFDVLRNAAAAAGVRFQQIHERRWNERGEPIGPRSEFRSCEMVEYRMLAETVRTALEDTVTRLSAGREA